MQQHKLRDDLLQIYTVALQAVNGRDCVGKRLNQKRFEQPLSVIAIGKAAAAMMAGAEDVLQTHIDRALMITKTGHDFRDSFQSNIEIMEGGHPWPTAASLRAGERLLAFIDETPASAPLLFLISGGASALVEVLPDGISLEDLRQTNQWLLGSGLDIHAMNHVRKAISCIKGGRLAQRLAGRPTRVLLISDVPGDDSATIGSGLLVPEILLETEASVELPAWITALMDKGSAMPEREDAAFENIEIEIIATLGDAKRAAAEQGRALGYDVYEHGETLGGDAVLVGRQLAAELLSGPPSLHVWGGETTVQLPKNPGQGGRNQHLALAAAIELAGDENVALLSAGTDGTDGPTDDAGALVDGGTLRRGEDEGLDAGECLAQCNSGAFLSASGDLIQTGPTGTNVMDLMIGVKCS